MATWRCRNVGGEGGGELLVCMLHIYEAGEGKIIRAAGRGGCRLRNWEGGRVSDGCDSLESQMNVHEFFTVLRTICLTGRKSLSS